MVQRQWAVLRSHPEFFKLWGGQTISSFGSAITGLALPLTAVVARGATPLQMGLLGTVGFLPQLLFSLPAGVWVDRLPRRPILIGADLGRAILLGSIPVMALLGLLRIEALYIVAFLGGVCTLFFDVAALAFVPALVERERLVDANSTAALSDSVAMTAGPALAGGLVQLLTAPIAIVFDAFSFLVSAVFSILIRVREPAPATKHRRTRLWTAIGEGLRVLAAHPILRAMAVSVTLASFAGRVQSTVLVLYIVRELGLTPALLGVVFATSGVAAIGGSLLAGPASAHLGPGPTFLAGTMVSLLAALLLPVVGGPLVLAVAVLILAQGLRSIGTPLYSVNQRALRQTMAPARLLGRLNASWRFLVYGVVPLGSLLGGVLGQTVGLRATLAIGALAMLPGCLWVLLSPVRTLRELLAPAANAPTAS